MMPTKEQVEATPGTPLTKEELARLQAEGQLPANMDPTQGAPTLHRMKSGDQEFLVIMMDPPPCGCVRLPTGKKKRCKKHRMERRARRKAKARAKAEKGTKMVKDDESDRKKLVELRHAADSESDDDKAIDGAFTPDKICAVGPTGVAVLVNIEKVETAEVGPRAKATDKPMRGILVKGAHETPQFIPDEKIQKDSNGKIKYRYYTVGELVKGSHGEAIFYADGQCQCDKKGNPQNMTVAGVDQNIQKKIGETLCVPVEVEVNEKGMPVVKQIACAEDVPKVSNERFIFQNFAWRPLL
ncbi:hypothetical protein ANCCAN_06917 [Ancylostoma caninum]|uniref:Uncharacterized protein n=1 Tax=Ancylostoma caninum TaxID=29170 RepID=A0A368GRU2_ANCCA|nr:hypothetical protein ANCCAN_06917 [Ancylostoma caninum]